MSLSEKQIDSILDAGTARISLWAGAVRSGKTFASMIAFFDAVAHAPASGLILITGRTLQTIERNILDPMGDPGLFGELAYSVQHTRGSSIAKILGRDVHLVGASDARAESKLRGLTACLAMADEATLMPEEFWTQLLARLSVPGARLMATTNPGSPAHWLKAKFLDRADELDMVAWHFTLDDNPSLSPEYVTALKAEHTGLFYRRNINGEWVSAEGAIYAMWNPDQHVIPWTELPPMRRLLSVGIDHGTTNASSAILLGLGENGTLYAIDEWRHDPQSNGARLTNDQQSEHLRTWLHTSHLPYPSTLEPEWLFVDPAAAQFSVQLGQDGEQHVQPADNQVSYGIATVASLLTMGALTVTDRCTGLIDEFPSYAWDPKATEKGEDKPLKVADHSLDAMRYAITTTETVWRPWVDDWTRRQEANRADPRDDDVAA